MKQEYYVTFQFKKTGKYDKKQYRQPFLPFPIELSRLWDIEKGQIVRLFINGSGEIILKKVESKPTNKQMKYEEWLAKIKPHIPKDAPGKTYHQICLESGLEMKAAPAEWVHRAENEIALKSILDKKTHRTLWSRAEQIKQTIQRKLPPYAEVAVTTS
jgi:bifunctional DNA-binding transcriptional regulator/antitoxin component of YhaV-PrlF toxin-antitoxin module